MNSAFDWLGSTLFLPVLQWLYALFGNLGLAIIVFTVLTRILILPLTLKQLRTQKKTMALQPKIRELQRKHGGDRERLAQETMKLYKIEGTSPLGGCLPLLVTMPILFGVWRAISQFEKAGGEQLFPFAWIPSLTPVTVLDTVVATGKDPYFILPVLSILLQYVVQLMAMPRNPDPQQAQMQKMMMFMPLVFGFIAFTMPSGAVLYWITGSLIAVVQQYFSTGFGSLPKYLPFLPERTGFLTPVPVVQTAGDEPITIDAEPERRDFWTVMSKLQEPSVSTAGADGATELAIADAKAQSTTGKQRR